MYNRIQTYPRESKAKYDDKQNIIASGDKLFKEVRNMSSKLNEGLGSDLRLIQETEELSHGFLQDINDSKLKSLNILNFRNDNKITIDECLDIKRKSRSLARERLNNIYNLSESNIITSKNKVKFGGKLVTETNDDVFNLTKPPLPQASESYKKITIMKSRPASAIENNLRAENKLLKLMLSRSLSSESIRSNNNLNLLTKSQRYNNISPYSTSGSTIVNKIRSITKTAIKENIANQYNWMKQREAKYNSIRFEKEKAEVNELRPPRIKDAQVSWNRAKVEHALKLQAYLQEEENRKKLLAHKKRDESFVSSLENYESQKTLKKKKAKKKMKKKDKVKFSQTSSTSIPDITIRPRAKSASNSNSRDTSNKKPDLDSFFETLYQQEYDSVLLNNSAQINSTVNHYSSSNNLKITNSPYGNKLNRPSTASLTIKSSVTKRSNAEPIRSFTKIKTTDDEDFSKMNDNHHESAQNNYFVSEFSHSNRPNSAITKKPFFINTPFEEPKNLNATTPYEDNLRHTDNKVFFDASSTDDKGKFRIADARYLQFS